MSQKLFVKESGLKSWYEPWSKLKAGEVSVSVLH